MKRCIRNILSELMSTLTTPVTTMWHSGTADKFMKKTMYSNSCLVVDLTKK